jgi:hypothetical protein
MPTARVDQPRGHRERKTSPWYIWFLSALVLLSFGFVLGWFGCTAISDRYYEVHWRATGPITFGKAHGTIIYEGAAALRMGFGLLSSGFMATIWAYGLILQFFRRKISATTHRYVASVLCWISFALLITTIACFFPVWELRSIPFFATLLVIFAFGMVGWRLKRISKIGLFVPFLGAIGIVVGLFDPGTTAHIVMAIFAALAIFAHVSMLFPQVERMIRRSNPKPGLANPV